MKTVKYMNMQIQKFQPFYRQLHKQHPEILGAEWDGKEKLLKVFYQDDAMELTKETIQNVKIPSILKFRKKLPTITNIPNAKFTSENEFVVETFDAKNTRKKIKKEFPEFEETKI